MQNQTQNQKICIIVKGYDHCLVDQSAAQIVKTAKSTGSVVTGPVPLPVRKNRFDLLKSPHADKDAREQFQICTHKRMAQIHNPTSNTVDALMRLDLPAGVNIEIKLLNEK